MCCVLFSATKASIRIKGADYCCSDDNVRTPIPPSLGYLSVVFGDNPSGWFVDDGILRIVRGLEVAHNLSS